LHFQKNAAISVISNDSSRKNSLYLLQLDLSATLQPHERGVEDLTDLNVALGVRDVLGVAQGLVRDFIAEDL
jgi:hypothetical protein